ncbi:MAG TPA: hypothetical protein VHF89_09335 [Solirubrobacteraceae bacterium]|nr:hypothetical protein [Solirubrobacteraceae bacterium]
MALLASAGCGGGGGDDQERNAAAVCAERWAAPDNKQRVVVRDALLRSNAPALQEAAWVGPSPKRESTCVTVVRFDRERRATQRIFVELREPDEKRGSWAEAAAGELTRQQVEERMREPNASIRTDGSLEVEE